MTKEEWPTDLQFNEWWNAGVDGEDNPYKRMTPAYWAWEGWLAGRAAEREACARLCEEMASWHGDLVTAAYDSAADAIRKRGRG
jgi:hypothetical protein